MPKKQKKVEATAAVAVAAKEEEEEEAKVTETKSPNKRFKVDPNEEKDEAPPSTEEAAAAAAAAPTVTVHTNKEGESYFDLSSKKRLTVRTWKGSLLFDIREFYQKGGEDLPGNKGISLTLDQYKVLKEVIQSGLVETCIVEKGGSL